MLNKRKQDIEARKSTAELKLAMRLDDLKAQGLNDGTIRKDAAVRQIRAAIRQARRQMDRIGEIEALDRKKADIKEQKRNAPKEVHAKAKKAPQGESRRKAKREKKQSLQGQEDGKE